jgi:general secretion pathway protein D
MNTSIFSKLLAGMTAGLLTAAAQQPSISTQARDSSSPAPQSKTAELATTTATTATPSLGKPANLSAEGITNALAPTTRPAYVLLPNGQKGVRLNFRGVPLETVLSYLSKAAGLIINLETPVKGTVDVWSDQPVSIEEAVNLVDSVLNKNGYSALHAGRTLTIVSRATAKTQPLPVKTGNRAAEIPKNDQMITQIIPVRYANAVAMTKDLQPLLPAHANLTANESGNALVLTDVQSDVRRMVEIVQALDTSISGIASVRVFKLEFADAKDLASVLKELFPTSSNTGNSGRGGGGGNQFPVMFGGGPGGGPGGGGLGADSSTEATQSEARQAASRVTAVADERTNSLIVGAPDGVMPVIAQLVSEMDSNGQNITHIRTFHLKHADPLETVDFLTTLFPDDSKTDNSRSVVQFGAPGFAGGPGFGGNTQATTSNRAQQKARVQAVADQRTSTLVVSASSDLMPTIEKVIARLDASSAKKQKLFVYSVKNGDLNSMKAVLQDMFATTTQSSSSSAQTTDALSTRATQAAQSIGQSITQQTSSGGALGSSSIP